MKKTTVVFDLDGTLLDTLQDLANAVNYALEQQGMPKRTLEEVRSFCWKRSAAFNDPGGAGWGEQSII